MFTKNLQGWSSSAGMWIFPFHVRFDQPGYLALVKASKPQSLVGSQFSLVLKLCSRFFQAGSLPVAYIALGWCLCLLVTGMQDNTWTAWKEKNINEWKREEESKHSNLK